MSIEVKMAWRNLWRNTRRTVLTIAAIAFACLLLVFMLSWQFGTYDVMINTAVGIHSGHLQVQAKGYNDKQAVYQVVPDPASVSAAVAGVPQVTAHTLRAKAFAMASSARRTYGAMAVGIAPASEAAVSTLAKLIFEGEFLAKTDTDQALAGRLLAQNLKIGLGEELVLLGQGRDGSVAATVVKIKGIINSGQDVFDRSTVLIPLGLFQESFAMQGTVHEVVLRCRSLQDVAPVKLQLQDKLAAQIKSDTLVVLDWTELMPGLLESIKLDLVSGFIFYFILIIVVAFSILNTFLMSVFERTREFGVMLAMGTTPGRLTRILLFESSSMTLIGILIGALAGAAVTQYFAVHGIAIADAAEILREFGLPERIHPRLSILSVTIGSGIVLVITFTTTLYPAFKVRRLIPVQALRA